MRRVQLESPYVGNIEFHTDYARECMRDCFKRGEAPFASHLLYTQVGILLEEIPQERELGISAGLAWGSAAEATVVYQDFGISSGMRKGIERAKAEGRLIEYRNLYKD